MDLRILAVFVVGMLLFAGCLGGEQKATGGSAGGAQAGNAGAGVVANKSVVVQEEEEKVELPEGVRAAYLDYNEDEYGNSLGAKKIVFLEFTNPECVQCAEFEGRIRDAFMQMGTSKKYANVVGFKVDMQERPDVAEFFGVSEPNTHVIIGRDGTVKLKVSEQWDAQKLKDAIAQESQQGG